MLVTITLRNVGTAAITVGLLVAALTLGTASNRPFILAGLLVLVGTGLRLEAAVRARNTHHQDTGH
ncbi:hypothetical protein ACH4OY_30610 [Micromonospora rubida]|uniref:Uncharacterized protein n=1 Tax=Micromonospora rubida TaxID=2697657 RepID=A0ABW7SXI5_9ACTN